MTSRYLLYFSLVGSILPFFSLGKTTIRLQPNTAGSGVSGILQVKQNGTWGTVCNDEWDMKDTVVACRQLGFNRAVGFLKYSRGRGPVLLNWMKCTGLETSLQECSRKDSGVSSPECFKHVHDIGIVCSSHTGPREANTMTLRLQPDTQGLSFAGILQVYHNNQWGTVCHRPFTWDITDTTVACRQLGFNEVVGFWHEARGEGQVWMKDVQCTGQETSLQRCPHDIVKEDDRVCKDHRYDVGIVCSGPEQNVRLANGTYGNEGRIEVKLEGSWGTVCGDYGWSIENSNVICRMLGHKQAVKQQNFGAGSKSYPIWLQQLSCKGCEMSMAECQVTNYSLPNCNHEKDVGVVCLPKGKGNIAVRLAAGDTNFIRRVEVRYHGIWGSICTNNWDIRDAHVVCRMKGYERASVAMATRKESNDKVWLDYLDCSGKETTIDDCKNVMWNWKNKPCSTDLRAGVVCLKDKLKLQFHLKERLTEHAGKLEVEYYGKRGNLCYDNLDLNTAHVICNMLGYQEAVTISSWGQQTKTSFSLSLKCDGSVRSTDDCEEVSLNQVDRCYNNEIAGIVCKEDKEYNEKEELRLVEGSDDHEGRVQVKHHGVWGTVCTDGWDMRDASVVCRMKGYQGAIAAYKKFPQGSGPIWLTGLNCQGHENSTVDCDREGLDKTKSCSHKNDIGVVCYSGKGHLQVSLEMDNRSSLYEGRVKIKVNNETGTIDDEQWDIHDAHVVCKMLKLSRAIAAISLFREEPGKVFFSKVRCNGTEESLEMCDHGGWGAGTQDHRGYDAGVICARPSIAQAKMMVGTGSNDGAVTGLSILIVILVMVIVSAFLWYLFKLRNEKNEDSQDKTQGLQLERQVVRGSGDTDDYYQAPPSLGDQRYVTSQESDRGVRQTRGRKARNVQESEESMYLEVRR